MENNTAFIVGYTGATGKALVEALILDKHFTKILLIGRRKVELPQGADDRFVQEVINFDEIENHKDAFKDCSVGFCVLGTLTGVAGKDGLVRVDRDYVIKTATVAKEMGCKQFHLLSSQGADKNSMILYSKTKVNLLHVGEFKTLQSSSNFPDRWLWFSPNQISVLNTYKHMFEEVYFESIPLVQTTTSMWNGLNMFRLRVKFKKMKSKCDIEGQAEEGVTNCNFDKLSIYRPGGLIAEREQKRPLETFFFCCFCCCIKCCRNQWVMPVEDLAAAMLRRTKSPPETNVEILTNAEIDRLAKN